MQKLILLIVASIFSAVLLTAADQPAPIQPNPFEKYDKELKKLEEKKSKAKDDKSKKGVDTEIKRANDLKDKALKKLTAPFEKEKDTLKAELDKMKTKDKNADLKQARIDYLDKMIQYYNDLSSGKTTEMPKEAAKNVANPATKDKPAVVPDNASEKGTDSKPAENEAKDQQ